ncbi:cobalt-precorrin-7 (C(5))-methyltransferase [Lactobacillus sp. 3B(2020)]|uniref:cobalt-precorrin-7 (C(5))-methyltransferase n=1 Tax=Lactobacillus sp. 3B(2020) TaxID=2695882 RepID=UPI0015DE5A80|nr:cobalt-precorrin-7 (C(5))-methyltransferase [Lactobacillus sp. 3B(2020)]QLL69171.1 cobalt-precorrin-7 (C(5))-methyltransferase [Lactobacillus sp. 3B(2020)]
MITVVGIGPGRNDLQLKGLNQYLAQATLVVGSKRQLTTMQVPKEKAYPLPRLATLKAELVTKLDENIVILASGDPLLYGIGTWAIHNFPTGKVKVVPGISSMQYCFHQFGLSMNDCYFTSSHGRRPDFDFLLAHEKVAMVTDRELGPYQIAQEILKRGQKRRLYIGENLSYPDEKLTNGLADQVQDREYGLNVVIITNA